MNIKPIEWKRAKFGFRDGYVGDLRVFTYGPNTRRGAPNLVLQAHLDGFGDRYWECEDDNEVTKTANRLLVSYIALFETSEVSTAPPTGPSQSTKDNTCGEVLDISEGSVPRRYTCTIERHSHDRHRDGPVAWHSTNPRAGLERR